MAETVQCVRCGREAPGVERLPRIDPASAEDVRQKICADCWAEWMKAEVMVINELRLNFMDPQAPAILDRHMREFLLLDGEPAGEG